MSEISRELFLDAVCDKVANKAAATKILQRIGHGDRAIDRNALKLYKDLSRLTSYGASESNILERINRVFEAEGTPGYRTGVTLFTNYRTPLPEQRLAAGQSLADFFKGVANDKGQYRRDLAEIMRERKQWKFPSEVKKTERRAAEQIANNKRERALRIAQEAPVNKPVKQSTVKPVDAARNLLYGPVLGY